MYHIKGKTCYQKQSVSPNVANKFIFMFINNIIYLFINFIYTIVDNITY